MIKRIMLVNPPVRVRAGSLRRISEPLGLLSIATYLETRGYEADVFDMAAEGYDNIIYEEKDIVYGSTAQELTDRIKDFKPDMVGISCIFTFQMDIVFELCKVVKQNPEIITVVGGGTVTRNKELFMQNECIDFCSLGEGEYRLTQLVENINNNKPIDNNLDGVCGRTPAGDWIIKEPVGFIMNRDELPFPKRHFVDMEKYIKIGKPPAPYHMGERVAVMSTSKGCPCKCTFCNFKDLAGNTIRFRSVDHVIAEIEYLIDTYKIDEIQFIDENLNVNKERAKELFRRLKKYNIKWCTPLGLYFNSIDEEMLELMHASGAYQITFAIESASKRVLKELMNKNVEIDRCKAITDKAHSLGMFVHAFFLVGMPGETREELMQTLRFPFLNNLDSVSFNIVCAYIGSELYDLCVRKGYLNDDADIMSTNLSTEITNIVIPEDSEDYVMSASELAVLVKNTTEEFNNHVKEKFPDIWERKYGKFLRKSTEYEDKIMFRG